MWLSNRGAPLGKGITAQQFCMNAGNDRFEMEVSAWGQDDLRKNGASITRVTGRKNRREVFLSLKRITDDNLNVGEQKRRNLRSATPIVGAGMLA
jgi:hypothetical protein